MWLHLSGYALFLPFTNSPFLTLLLILPSTEIAVNGEIWGTGVGWVNLVNLMNLVNLVMWLRAFLLHFYSSENG